MRPAHQELIDGAGFLAACEPHAMEEMNERITSIFVLNAAKKTGPGAAGPGTGWVPSGSRGTG
jgi:hypothetical protein